MHHNIMPQEYINMMSEIMKHPTMHTDIINQMDSTGSKGTTIDYIEAAATLCGIIVEGMYDDRGLRGLCTKIADAMLKKRTGIILIGATDV